jgi:lipoate-protein ligase A
MNASQALQWRWFDSGVRPPAENMACDEALLSTAEVAGVPTLRFYGWAEPAATFGYSQRHGEVAGWTLLRPLLRRPTGGGLVPHDSDWTYSVVMPPGQGWHELRAAESYERVHRWIVGAFARMGVETTLCVTCRKEGPGQCFVGAERHDVLWCGRKVAGAAQRRNRLGLLIQGSVQPPPLGLRRQDWQAAMVAEAAARWGVRWTEWEPGEEFASVVAGLVRERYGQAAFHERR